MRFSILSWPLAACLLLTACTDEPDRVAPDVADNPGAAGSPGTADEYPRLDGSYANDCEGYTQRLRDCGLLTSGPLSCEDPRDARQQCAFACLAIASCAILAEAQCTGVTPVPLNRCLIQCNGFICDSGETIPESWRCDGEPDCEDGSDEDGCLLECGSGETVSTTSECDFFPDCEDASDEVDCEGFECGSGELISSAWRCDLESDCVDASDEAGCEWFRCEATGLDIPPSWQCDGAEDCLDGSDEFGCARLICD